jgi:hypothetical protein
MLDRRTRSYGKPPNLKQRPYFTRIFGIVPPGDPAKSRKMYDAAYTMRAGRTKVSRART